VSSDPPFLYGLVGEFVEPDAAVAMARQLREDGFRSFDVYSPVPLEEMTELLPRRRRTALALIMFAGALGGLVLGFVMQYVIAVVGYPLNIGGRPLNSWPAFIPSAWEICALFVVYIGFLAFLAYCRLPQLYHPIFNAPRFERASQDRTFVCVEAQDPRFDADRVAAIFRKHRAARVAEVPK
jgi:MFS family permease